jgi:hypothetical protein
LQSPPWGLARAAVLSLLTLPFKLNTSARTLVDVVASWLEQLLYNYMCLAWTFIRINVAFEKEIYIYMYICTGWVIYIYIWNTRRGLLYQLRIRP